MPITPARQGRFVGLRFLSLLSSFTPITPASRIARHRRGLLWPVLITGAALLAACGGGGGGGGGSEPSGPTVTISGTATYDFVPTQSDGTGLDYSAITQKPIRGATVQLITSGGYVQASTVTDAQGAYSLSTTGNRAMKVRVRAELKDDTSPGTYTVTVQDNTASDALYVLDSDQFTPTANETRDLRASSGWGGSSYTGTRAAAPFAVLDVAYQALQKVINSAPSVSLPTLRMFWSKNNVASSGTLSLGQIGTSFFRYSSGNYSLYLLGAENSDTDEYDTHVVAHEFGHYLQRAVSADDSIGGSHTSGDLLDMRVAFSEGWGNGWAGIALNDPKYTDSYGSQQGNGFGFDVSVAPGNSEKGFFSEASGQYLIWSLNADNAIGFTPIYNALVALKSSAYAQFTSLHSFRVAIRSAVSSPGTVDTLWQGQGIFSTDAYGANETNFGTITEANPVYKNYTTNGTAQQYCTTNAAGGTYNKLGNSVFVKFTTSGARTVTVAAVTQNNTTDPDFSIVTSSGTRLQSASVAANTESRLVSFPSGTHVLAFSDYNETAACFNFTVSN